MADKQHNNNANSNNTVKLCLISLCSSPSILYLCSQPPPPPLLLPQSRAQHWQHFPINNQISSTFIPRSFFLPSASSRSHLFCISDKSSCQLTSSSAAWGQTTWRAAETAASYRWSGLLMSKLGLVRWQISEDQFESLAGIPEQDDDIANWSSAQVFTQKRREIERSWLARFARKFSYKQVRED